MKFTLLTYNLFLNRAYKNVGSLLAKYQPEIVCLQELSTKDPNLHQVEQYGYKLADYSNSFSRGRQVFGVATFYNSLLLTHINSRSFNLSRGFYEFMRYVAKNEPQKRTVLKTKFMFKKTGKKVRIYNLHLDPFGTNRIRDKQIREAFEDLDLSAKEPIVTAGDFNYPYGRKKFEYLINDYGLSEATNTIFYTHERRVLKLISIKIKLDYVLYKNIKNIKTERLRVRHSDHFPILSTFEM